MVCADMLLEHLIVQLTQSVSAIGLHVLIWTAGHPRRANVSVLIFSVVSPSADGLHSPISYQLPFRCSLDENDW